MKIITLDNNTRDGQLALLNDKKTHYITIAEYPSFQSALDHWAKAKPLLQAYADALNNTTDTTSQSSQPNKPQAFDWSQCHAPLPRAYQWIDGSAYVNHVELVRKARGATMPESFWTDPLMYQGGSDTFLRPSAPIKADPSWGIDCEGEIGIITDDVPLGVTPEAAVKHIQCVLLINDVSLRNLIPGELAKSFGFFQSKPSSAFAPIALTPDELGQYWDGQKLHRPLTVTLNGEIIGTPDAGEDMIFSFADLIAHAAKTRSLSAGTIIGSGTVSNKNTAKGVACLAEKRMLEIIATGAAATEFMQPGNTIQLDVFDEQGESLFGSIKQNVQSL